MTSSLLRLAESDGGAHVEPWVLAAVAFTIFLLLLGFVWSFRHTVAPREKRVVEPDRHPEDASRPGAATGTVHRSDPTHRTGN